MSECQRCGLCCQDSGDIAGDLETVSGPCSALFFEGKRAVCRIQQEWGRGEKPDVCKNYPFDDIDNGKCTRELAEMKNECIR